MAEIDDYCELCDLPKSQCVHGRPTPAPAPAPAKAAPKPKKRATPTTSSASSAPDVATRRTTRRWTPPDVFKPLILTVLEEAGGELTADDLFDELGERVAGELLAGDHEKTPEGELRWRYAARRARQGLIADGLMTKGRPGVWSLA